MTAPPQLEARAETSGVRVGLALFAVSAATGSFVLAQTMLIPALPRIAMHFETTPVGATTLASAFFLAGGVTVGPIGRMADMWGRQQVMVAVLGLFALGGLLCVLAPSLPVMVLGRILSGVGAAIVPLSFALVRDTAPPDQVERGLALVGAIVGGGSAIGLTLGGVITDHASFRWVFGIGAVSAVVSLAAVLAWTPRSRGSNERGLDVVGAALLALGLTPVLLAISFAPGWGWTNVRGLGLLLVAVVVLALFVRHERRYPTPLLHLDMLTERQVALTNGITFLLGVGLFAMTILLAQFYQVPQGTSIGVGATATQAGLLLLPGSLVMLLASPWVAKLNERRGPRFAVRLGAAISVTCVTGMALSVERFEFVVLTGTVLCAGICLVYSALPMLLVSAVPSGRTAQAMGVNQLMRAVGSSLGVQAAAAVVSSSIGADGAIHANGYRDAFIILALACAGAFVLACALAATPAASRVQTA